MVIARLLDTLGRRRVPALVAGLGDQDTTLWDALAETTCPEPVRDHAEHAAEAALHACHGFERPTI